MVLSHRAGRLNSRNKGRGKGTPPQHRHKSVFTALNRAGWHENKTKQHTCETDKKKDVAIINPLLYHIPPVRMSSSTVLLGRDDCVCVCLLVSRQSVAELRCCYLSGLVAWRSGGRWRRPEGGSPSLVRGCCWEESWPVATSPFWASATHTHNHTRFFVRTSEDFPFFQTA